MPCCDNLMTFDPFLLYIFFVRRVNKDQQDKQVSVENQAKTDKKVWRDATVTVVKM